MHSIRYINIKLFTNKNEHYAEEQRNEKKNVQQSYNSCAANEYKW